VHPEKILATPMISGVQK